MFLQYVYQYLSMYLTGKVFLVKNKLLVARYNFPGLALSSTSPESLVTQFIFIEKLTTNVLWH